MTGPKRPRGRPAGHSPLAETRKVRVSKRAAERLDAGETVTARVRLDVPATEATVQAVRAHAARTGRTRATVAGDMLETATQALRGEGGSDE